MTAITPAPHEVYELVLLQFRPDLTSEETFNIGVVAFNAERQRLVSRVTDHYSRLRKAYPDLDGSAYRSLARALAARCNEVGDALRRDQLRIFGEQQFQNLLARIVAPGSSNFGWSSVRRGVCEDLTQRVDETFYRYITRLEERSQREYTTNEELWRRVSQRPSIQPILSRINYPKVMQTPFVSHEFRGGWMNGRLNVVDSITFDYQDPSTIADRAVLWVGRVGELAKDHDYRLVALVTDRRDDETGEAYNKAIAMLRANDQVRDVIPESDADRLAVIVNDDLGVH